MTAFRLPRRWLLVASVVVPALYAGVMLPWQADPVVVAVEVLAPGTVSQVLAVNGRIAARHSVTVRAAVAAQAVTVPAEEGAQVAVGQVLLTLDTALIDAGVEQAAAALEAQQALQRQAQVAVDRARALGASSPRTVLEDAELRLASLQQETARLQAALRQVRRQLDEFTIRAPIAGAVIARDVDPGQQVDPQTDLFTIADTADLVVEADIDELYSAHVREGLRALLRPVGTATVQQGRVVFAAPAVDPDTGGRKIKIAFDADVALPVGLTVNANVIVAEVDNALSLPRRAIVMEGGQAHVLVVEDGVAVRRGIGFSDWPSDRVIVEGLRAGEAVVLDPSAVAPGDKVARAAP